MPSTNAGFDHIGGTRCDVWGDVIDSCCELVLCTQDSGTRSIEVCQVIKARSENNCTKLLQQIQAFYELVKARSCTEHHFPDF
jgi:hypothetical protein